MKAVLHTLDGKVYVGYNDILEPSVESCPRKGLASGEGYELCKQVCKQPGHAEIMAIKSALLDGAIFEGSTLYLYGHTYCCDNCLIVMQNIGIDSYFINNEQHFFEKRGW